ncbi:MAG: ABC transporter permease [Firmicutes bacterium]|nr:ABC transporter permease [Bacillota bacterium]
MKALVIANERRREILNNQSLVRIALIIIICTVSTIVNPRFANVNNIINIFQQISVLGIIASGVGMLLVAGEIDISVGAQVSLIGVILAMIIQKVGGLPNGNPLIPMLVPFAIPIAVILAFLIGAIMGMINGITVVKTKAPSFIITLGFSSMYSAIALLVTGGGSYMLFGRFQTLGRGKIFNFIPVSILFFLGTMTAAFIVLKYTKYGRFLYAIGGNKKAAYVSGINTRRIILTAYVVVGIVNALAALILISRVGSALANTGDSYSLDALASVIVGGISLHGGKGDAISSFLGVVLIGLISNSLVIMNVTPFLRGLVIGLVTIAAVTGGSLSDSRE